VLAGTHLGECKMIGVVELSRIWDLEGLQPVFGCNELVLIERIL
jgi:hypothetical protein